MNHQKSHAVQRITAKSRKLFSPKAAGIVTPLSDLDKAHVDEEGTWLNAKAAGIQYGKGKIPAATIGRWYRAGRLKRAGVGSPAKRVMMRIGKGTRRREVVVYHQEAIELFIKEREQNLLPDQATWIPTNETKWDRH